MGGDDKEHSGQAGGRTVTRGWTISSSKGVSTAAGPESVTVSHSESCSGSGYPEDDRTVSVAWAEATAANGEENRRMLLEELVRLLADAPERVTLDGVAARGNDLLFTLRVPRALLAEVIGTAGTSEAPYLVLTRKGGTSEL